MKEGVDYVLTIGLSWFPIGRKFTTLKPIIRPNGKSIGVGWRWDGGTGFPMLTNSKTAYAFLCHDYNFSKRDMTMWQSNMECVKLLARDSNIFTAMFILLWFIILTPTLMAIWYTDPYGDSPFDTYGTLIRFIRTTALIINLFAISFLIFNNMG